MTAPICLLVNPSAGGGKAARLLPEVLSALEGHGLRVRVELTRDLEHARVLARTAALAGERVVCLSGDGLVGVVADVLREIPGSILGVLPGGRGNDLARVLGIPADAVQACAVIAADHSRRLDLGAVEPSGGNPLGEEHLEVSALSTDDGHAGGQAYVGIASVGFDSEANRIANKAPSWLGGFVYAYGALRALLSWRPARFEIELDPPGERHCFAGYTVGACNSKTYGGGMRAAPGALLDDGLLEVVLLEDVSKLRFVTRILPKVFSGTHVHEQSVKVFRAREITIGADRPFTMYADGDPIGELPLRVRALRGAVRVLVPTGAEGADAFLAEKVGTDTAPPRR